MKKDTDEIRGKIIIVTGAAHGIGRAIADVLCHRGAKVIIVDKQEKDGKRTADSLRRRGGEAFFFLADLRSEEDIRSAVEFSMNKFSRLDVVINNARPKLRRLPFNRSFEEWDLAMDVLLKAPALLAKHALPHMVKRKEGIVINLVSTNAFYVSQQPLAYHVAKAGLVQLTRYLAHEFGSHGVRVNAVCPGLVDIEDDRRPLSSDPINRKVIQRVVPLKRACSAEEVARVVLFLCSKGSEYISGQTIVMDGGMTTGDHFYSLRRAWEDLA